MASEWMPIETAPKNRAILLALPDRDYYGNGGVYAGMRVDMGSGERWFSFGWACGRDFGPGELPTHWMPIPAPPASE